MSSRGGDWIGDPSNPPSRAAPHPDQGCPPIGKTGPAPPSTTAPATVKINGPRKTPGRTGRDPGGVIRSRVRSHRPVAR
jgi:hypothetical protein